LCCLHQFDKTARAGIHFWSTQELEHLGWIFDFDLAESQVSPGELCVGKSQHVVRSEPLCDAVPTWTWTFLVMTLTLLLSESSGKPTGPLGEGLSHCSRCTCFISALTDVFTVELFPGFELFGVADVVKGHLRPPSHGRDLKTFIWVLRLMEVDLETVTYTAEVASLSKALVPRMLMTKLRRRDDTWVVQRLLRE
jgi:hypothetical protein